MLKSRAVVATSLVALTVLVSACSDPKAASKENFTAALKDSVEPVCFEFYDPAKYDFMGVSDFLPNPIIKPMQAKGLVEVKEFGYRKGAALTPAGKEVWDKELSKQFDQHKGLCLGKFAFNEVVAWTEPQNGVTTVTYTVKLEGLPDWMKSGLDADFPGVKAPFENKAKLTLMNEGWRKA